MLAGGGAFVRHKHPLHGAQSLPDNLSQSAAVLTGVCDSSEGTLCVQQLHPPYTHLCAHLPRELALGETSFSPSLALVLCLPRGRALCAALGTAIAVWILQMWLQTLAVLWHREAAGAKRCARVCTVAHK